MIDHVPIAIYAKSMRKEDFGQYVLWNKASEAIFGISTEDALGKTVHELFAEPAAERARKQDASVIARRWWKTLPKSRLNRMVPLFFTYYQGAAFDNEDNVDMCCISEDITDRKQAAG
jgi:PAS domain S-box-containing protein